MQQEAAGQSGCLQSTHTGLLFIVDEYSFQTHKNKYWLECLNETWQLLIADDGQLAKFSIISFYILNLNHHHVFQNKAMFEFMPSIT